MVTIKLSCIFTQKLIKLTLMIDTHIHYALILLVKLQMYVQVNKTAVYSRS